MSRFPDTATRDPAAIQEAQPTPPDALPTEFHFTYPENSRLRATLAIPFFGVFGLGLLSPLLRGEEIDPANGWLLFVLGTMGLFGAASQVRQLAWTDTSLHLNPEGIFHRDHRGREQSIAWRDLRQVRIQRIPFLMIFTGADGTRIHAYPEMRNFDRFQGLILGVLGGGS